MARVDHVSIAVKDAEQAAASFFQHYGLQAYSGGRIAGIGVHNYLVPLGDGYIELVSICDEREAAGNPLGRAVMEAVTESDASFLTWAVQVDETVQPTADRLELHANPLKRALPDGGDTMCTIVGLQQALDQPSLPYFVEWKSRATRPDQTYTEHEVDPTGFAYVEIGGNKKEIDRWLGPDASGLPLQVIENEPGINAVSILLSEGDPIVLRKPLKFNSEQALSPYSSFDPSSAQPVDDEKEQKDPVAKKGFATHSGNNASERHENVSVFESVLDRVEHAIESAAEVVENVAGNLMSPRGNG